MEPIGEPPIQNVTHEIVKINDCSASFKEPTNTEGAAELDVCHKSNGVADSKVIEQVIDPGTIPLPQTEDSGISNVVDSSQNVVEATTEIMSSNADDISTVEEVSKETVNAPKENPINTDSVNKHDLEVKSTENIEDVQEHVEVDGIVETVSDNIQFETEILIETNVDDQPSKFKIIYSDTEEGDANQILNELGQNIELSEVLRSSDVTEHVENNNCEVRQQVFNKEELLDILEGNDVEGSRKIINDNFSSDCKDFEAQLALQQLTRLQKSRSSKRADRRNSKKIESPREEISKKKRKLKDDNLLSSVDSVGFESKDQTDVDIGSVPREESNKKRSKKLKEDNLQSSVDSVALEPKEETDGHVAGVPREESIKKRSKKPKDDNDSDNKTTSTKEENIVKALFKDWEDDEHNEGEQVVTIVQEVEIESEELAKTQEDTVNKNNDSNADTPVNQEPHLNKSDSEVQPQRRLGRVIKKKVIFDPDNPDTFTKSKVTVKKENQTDKDVKDPTPKKIKSDQTILRSKSPIQSKLQWKKPQPKNLKQNKRLTEIDRLLMDEGAVNMICQLTPEAPKGHKNMKSKAEFIKKIQSSTPEGKEMKFRERKKELRGEEGDAKKVGSVKDRLSLSSSVKSPCVSEDFEAHSADDSIIYRRHSSSSYSSPCMSPRRMSDVESINQNLQLVNQSAAFVAHGETPRKGKTTESSVFMSVETIPAGVINKNDLLSIKEKLNSKLSQVLNKRKRDSTKPDKPPKIKKPHQSSNKFSAQVADYKYVKVVIEHRLAEICIHSTGSTYNVEVINELKNALAIVDIRNDVSVTLLTAESGSFCSGLDLKPLLDEEKGLSYARELAESMRSLLCVLEGHSKLVCATVEDKCHGIDLGIIALSDITVASETAIFKLTADNCTLLQPGAAVLNTCGLPQYLLNEMVVFERAVTATEALRSGLVSRTIWPERFLEQARAIARDISAQPTENIMLKKQLLRLKKGGTEVFQAALDNERDLFVKYWTSTECRDILRATLEAAKE